jgi:hypothetical protein
MGYDVYGSMKNFVECTGISWWGTAGVISIPSNDSTFVSMMKRE